jgi:hypothetical protein
MSNRKVLFAASIASVLVLLVGAAVLMTWDVPRPTAQVEKVIPDERFPR